MATTLDKSDCFECTVCGEFHSASHLALLPCGHYFCRECFTRRCKAILTDEAMCPPRCCQGSPIPLQQIQQVLDPELFKAYQDRTQEINTPHKDRMYCSRETRVSFTTLSNIDGRWAACQKCGRATCVSCGEKEHGKTQCGVDTSEEQVKELARESGWKSCPKCGHLIERESGCNEIICRYGAKVCYRCGGIFDICSCPVIEFFGDDYFEDEDEDEDNDNFGDNNVNDFGT